MPGIRARVDRLRSKLGAEPAPEFAIVSIGCVMPGRPIRPSVERYEGGCIGCLIPPTPGLARALLGLKAIGVELGPDDTGLRPLILDAADPAQRRILDGVPDWSVAFEI